MSQTQTAGRAIGARLSVMMFIQFFIWGAWYVMAPIYLRPIGFKGNDIGTLYAVGPIAGMISPFFMGMVVDRFFSTERVLGVMHLLGAAAMYAATVMMKADPVQPFAINMVIFVYMLCYFPTLALTNTLALKNMTNAEKQFPLIRVFGTIGWIAAGLLISKFTWDGSINMFYLAAGASALMGVYSLTLPHTPPARREHKPTFREIIGIDAFVLFKNRSFLTFMVSSFLICIPLAFYYQLAASSVNQVDALRAMGTAQVMTFGQMSEIFFMLVMPLFFARLGVKWMLLVGMLAWVVRYALFAIGAPSQVVWMMILGVILHGICYDFFFVTGQIYTDKIAPANIRGQAQGMLVLFTLGLGMFIGAKLGGLVEQKYTPVESHLLLADSGSLKDTIEQKSEKLAGLVETAEKSKTRSFSQFVDEHASTLHQTIRTKQQELASLTNDEADEKKRETLKLEIDELYKQYADNASAVAASYHAAVDGRQEMDSLTTELQYLRGLQESKTAQAQRIMDWKIIWAIPAGMAAVVMVLFMFMFKDDPSKYANHQHA